MLVSCCCLLDTLRPSFVIGSRSCLTSLSISVGLSFSVRSLEFADDVVAAVGAADALVVA